MNRFNSKLTYLISAFFSNKSVLVCVVLTALIVLNSCGTDDLVSNDKFLTNLESKAWTVNYVEYPDSIHSIKKEDTCDFDNAFIFYQSGVFIETVGDDTCEIYEEIETDSIIGKWQFNEFQDVLILESEHYLKEYIFNFLSEQLVIYKVKNGRSFNYHMQSCDTCFIPDMSDVDTSDISFVP